MPVLILVLRLVLGLNISSAKKFWLGACVLLAGCGQSDIDQDFFPLSADIHWQYRVERTTMDGTSELRYAISSRVQAGDEGEAMAVRETIDGQRYYYRTDTDGVYRVGERPHDARAISYYAAKRLVLPRVPKPSQQWRGMTRTAVLESAGPPWETLFRINVPVEMHYRVESLAEIVETPSGTYSGCLLLSGFGKTSTDVGNFIGLTEIEVTTKEWFAPRVGLVRMERTERTDTETLNFGSLVMELDRF